MYGTVARFRLKDGHFDDVIALMDEWNREMKPKIDGAGEAFFLRTDRDANEVLMLAIFRDKQSYVANADNPEQDKWFSRMREHLAADPEWNDGEISQV